MSSNPDSPKVMTRVQLEDEVMLLRAQVKVLQDWIRMAKQVNGAEIKLYSAPVSCAELPMGE